MGDAHGGRTGALLWEHPTKANGYYTRDLLTLAGPGEDLRVPRVREALNGARKKDREALAEDLRFVSSALQMSGQKA